MPETLTTYDPARAAAAFDRSLPQMQAIPYRAEDAIEAQTIATEILASLDAADSTTKTWMSHQRRAWHLLLESYENVAAAGQFIFRGDGRRDKFPSIYAVTRSKRRRATTDEVETTTTTEPT
jgi:hypothetical protein